MINIKRKNILCKIHAIFHSEKAGCRKCRLNIDDYDKSNSYMKRRILKKLYKKISRDSKNEIGKDYKEKLDNYLNKNNNKEVLLYKNLRKKKID